jgi:hypothetical protein
LTILHISLRAVEFDRRCPFYPACAGYGTTSRYFPFSKNKD